MNSSWDGLVFGGIIVGGVALLAVIVTVWATLQNRRVLAWRADERLLAMLEAGEFLEELANDETVPESRRARAKELAGSYPQGDQLAVHAEALTRDLRPHDRAQDTC